MTLRPLAPLAAALLLPLLAACGDSPLQVDDPRECFDEDEAIPVIAPGDTLAGELTGDDCQLEDGSRIDVYALTLDDVASLAIHMRRDTLRADPDDEDTLDSYLLLWRVGDPDEEPELLEENDDDDLATLDARIDVTLGAGEYLVGANGFDDDDRGPYLLSVTD